MAENKDHIQEAKPLENKEKIKEQSLDNANLDSKKIDLYINDTDDESSGISLMHVFSYMKQRFHIFIFVMLITLILGTLVAILMYGIKDKSEKSIAILGLDYENAEEGLAPDGSTLDISYLKSSYIIQNALNDVVLSKNVGVAQIQENLSIIGILTDQTKQQMEILESLEELRSAEYARLIKEFELQYRAQYIITLDNGFKDGNNKVKLPSNELSHLLSSIINAYSKYFNDTYQEDNVPNDYINAIDTNSLDYLDILDSVQNSLNYLEAFCNEKSVVMPDFRSSDGLSFSDLSSMIHTINNTDVDYIYSYIYLNNISKNYNTQLTSYKYQKREATLELNEVNENIATVQTSIDNYKADKVVITNPESGQTTTIDVTSDYYNELVNSLTNLNERKSSLEEKITILDSKITKLEGTPATDEQIASVEVYVDSIVDNAKRMYAEVNKATEELYHSNAYESKYMHFITTYESDSLTSHLKSFVIGGVAGLFVGVVIWGVDALILEFKHSSKKEEE